MMAPDGICRRCGTIYRLAQLGDVTVFIAVPPWTGKLCTACDIEPRR